MCQPWLLLRSDRDWWCGVGSPHEGEAVGRLLCWCLLLGVAHARRRASAHHGFLASERVGLWRQSKVSSTYLTDARQPIHASIDQSNNEPTPRIHASINPGSALGWWRVFTSSAAATDNPTGSQPTRPNSKASHQHTTMRRAKNPGVEEAERAKEAGNNFFTAKPPLVHEAVTMYSMGLEKLDEVGR